MLDGTVQAEPLSWQWKGSAEECPTDEPTSVLSREGSKDAEATTSTLYSPLDTVVS